MTKAIYLSGAALLALAFAVPAQAQDTASTGAAGAAAPAPDTGDIIVTAQKREENLQRVPAAISVVTGAQFEAQGGVNVQSLQQLVPSLYF